MAVIDDFVARYAREYDFYEQVARRADALLSADLREAGVRCIVSNRAKSVDRLEAKCRQRDAKRLASGLNSYASVEEIIEDIVDLAGIRVALYFPAQRRIVAGAIARRFIVLEPPKKFPESGTDRRAGNPRFSGYSATHYRVKLQDRDLSDSEKGYATARIEIQVASVFMHGWSEVEHDLVYKPEDEPLSGEEYSLLDQLNGLAISAEIALESLQKANERRVAERSRRLADHYELATHLLDQPNIANDDPVDSSGLGRIDELFDFITVLRKNTPAKLDKYLNALHNNFEARPLADQVIDALLAEDASRYEALRSIQRSSSHSSEAGDSDVGSRIGRFLSSWIELEKLEQKLAPPIDFGDRILPIGRRLERLELLDLDMRREIDRIRRMRNAVVHGKEAFSPSELNRAAEQLDSLVEEIRRRAVRREG